MTNDLPPRRPFSVRARLLSVTGLAVVASLVIWHAQVIDLVSSDSSADKQPVVAGGPNGSPPPVQQRIPVKKTAVPSTTPSTPAKPKKSPSAKATKSAPVSEKSVASEESIEALSPKLRSRLKKAMAGAKVAGVPIRINSGRRSRTKQARLFKEAIQKYGSYQEAMRWVLPPDKSMHVLGKAVDIAPQAAMAWLGKNGWKYGICRRYDNEPWHFEALTAPGTKCPPIETNAVAERG
jgi:zinc D-Ala-D-Ala carboxypeptidase